MALTVLMALTGASILSLTFVPAAVAILVTGNVSERENLFMRAARRIYAPLLDGSLRNSFGVALIAALLVVVCAHCGDRAWAASSSRASMRVTFRWRSIRIPGTSLTQSVEMQEMLEKRLLQVPEVKDAFARTGSAEVATDPMPPSAGRWLRDAEAAATMALSEQAEGGGRLGHPRSQRRTFREASRNSPSRSSNA